MIIKRTTIAQYERALVWKNKRFVGVMGPGAHWIVTPFDQVELQTYDLNLPEFEHPRIDLLLREARATMEKYFHIVELADTEAGFVYKDGRLAGVLAPGKRQLYWRSSVGIRVERVDISSAADLGANVEKLLVREQQLNRALEAMRVVERIVTEQARLQSC
jgi:hypothetical protein